MSFKLIQTMRLRTEAKLAVAASDLKDVRATFTLNRSSTSVKNTVDCKFFKLPIRSRAAFALPANNIQLVTLAV